MKKALAIVVVVVGLLLVGVAVTRFARRPPTPASRSMRSTPGANLLLITLDTTRADYLGAYGGDSEVTPNLDELAGRGITYLQAQSPAPITLVAHSSMLTGRYPYRHGVRNNGMFALPSEIPTLATILADRGYRTSAFISAYVLARRYGLDRGFEVYDDDLSRGRHDHAHVVPSRRAEITTEAALAWFDGLDRGERFFCWIHYYDPHAPYDPPEEYRRRFPTDPYSGEIAYMDSVIGKLLDELDQRGLMDRTVVTAIGDHGESFGEHGEQTHAILLHQATLRVPWIVAGPGIPAGVRVNAPVSAVDLLPTLSELLRCSTPDGLDGVDLSALSVSDFETTLDRSIYAETMLPRFQYGWSPLRSLRRLRWELVSGVRDELFNLRDDPRELVDLMDRETATANELARELEEIVGQEEDPGSEATRTTISRSEMERLQALGYLGTEVTPRLEPPDPRDLITAHVHTERARGLASLGRADEALTELDVMLDLDPQNTSALHLQAQLLTQLRRPDEARRVLEHLLTLDPDSAQTYRQLAQLEMIGANPAKALELARMGAGKRGAFDELAVIEASALIALGRPQDAAGLLDRRLESRPDAADLLAARAGLWVAAGDLDAGERLLREAVGVDALHLRSRLALAELLDRRGDSAEAIRLLEDLLKIDPSHAEALGRIGSMLLDDPESARAYLEEAVRLEPHRQQNLLRLGVCYVRIGDHRRAEATLRRALELAPEDPDALSNLSVALTVQRRYREAEEALRRALEVRPRFAEARNNLALCLMYQNRLEEAEREVRAALDLYPEMRDARLTLSSIVSEAGRHGEAVTVLEQLRSEDPDDPELGARLGIALEAAGRPADALPVLRAAVVDYPQHAQVLRALARVEEAAGDPEAARRHFAALAQVAPPGPLRTEATAALERLALTRADG
jgi:arylsulfatase A-like enzyme/Flp pilus assembly protein TadD